MIIRIIKKNSFLVIIFLILFLASFLYDILLSKRVREDIKFWIDDINYRVDIITDAFQKSKSYLTRYYNDYNEEFLPETQNNLLDLKLIKLNFIRTFQLNYLKENPEGNNLLSYFIEFLEKDKLLIVDSRSNIFILKNFLEKEKIEVENAKHIPSNLNPQVDRVLDSHLFQDKLLFLLKV